MKKYEENMKKYEGYEEKNMNEYEEIMRRVRGGRREKRHESCQNYQTTGYFFVFCKIISCALYAGEKNFKIGPSKLACALYAGAHNMDKIR